MWHVCVTYCVMSFQSGSSGRQKTLRRHFYLTVKTLLWLNKNVHNPLTSWYLKAPKWVIEQSKHQNRETNFYRRCLNSEPNRTAPGLRPQKEFCPAGFPVLGDKPTSFEVVPSVLWHVDIIWDYLGRFLWGALTLFDGILTLSTRSPLNQPLSYSFTKTCGI